MDPERKYTVYYQTRVLGHFFKNNSIIEILLLVVFYKYVPVL